MRRRIWRRGRIVWCFVGGDDGHDGGLVGVGVGRHGLPEEIWKSEAAGRDAS